MTLEEAIRETPIIRDRDKESLFKWLKKDFPAHIEKWLYADSTDAESLYQGDIVLDLPVCFIDEDGDIIGGNSVVSLVSNTCDMQPGRKDFILVSPIISVDEYSKGYEWIGADIENHLADIRNNRIFSYFYLPQKGDFEESFIDFSQMITVHSDYLNNIKAEAPAKCKISLSRNGFYLFLIKLGYHFARMEYTTQKIWSTCPSLLLSKIIQVINRPDSF